VIACRSDACPKKDHPIQTFFLYGTDKSLRERVQVWGSWRQSNNVDALTDEYVTKSVRVFRVAVENRIPRAAKEAIAHVGDVARDLRHPSVVRMRGNAGDVYGSGGEVDKEQYVLRYETSHRADFDAQEVGGRQTFPVSLQKRRPSGVCAPLGSGLDPVVSEDIGDSAASNLMSKIG
jgi:hypothetical protein